jgi:hypothetical protein
MRGGSNSWYFLEFFAVVNSVIFAEDIFAEAKMSAKMFRRGKNCRGGGDDGRPQTHGDAAEREACGKARESPTRYQRVSVYFVCSYG